MNYYTRDKENKQFTEQDMETESKEAYKRRIASIGGTACRDKYGIGFYEKISKKGVAARKAKREQRQ